MCFCMTLKQSKDVKLIHIFNTYAGPYQPAVTIDISYNTSNQGEQPTMITMITEVPRWPGYQTSEFKINISNVGDNTLLRQINISEPRNGTIELRTSLPRSITNCSLFRVTVYALSEAYGESEPTEAYVELFKCKLVNKRRGEGETIIIWNITYIPDDDGISITRVRSSK